MIMCNDGTIVNCAGKFIHVSNGETYTLMGNMLVGPRGFMSMNVKSMSEAAAIVTGLHGGRKF